MAGNRGEPTVAPTPRSPPKYPDICGRRRLQLEVQILNRELGYLEQEELQSLEGHQPVSRCCKEVNEFVGTNPDPLVPINKKRCKSCHFWRWLGSKLGACLKCIFCCTSCSCQCKKAKCYNCCPEPKNLCCCCCYNCFNCKCHYNCFRCCSCPKISCCQLPHPFRCCHNKCSCCGSWNCSCCSCHETACFKTPKCCRSPTISCPEYSCGCVFDCPKCTEVHLCPKCTKPCCVTGCLC